jgi:hypothetical protein
MVGFSLQAVPPVIIISQGSSGSVQIPLTNVTGTGHSATLSYTGAPVGVTIAFAPNPDTTTSTATITVGAGVMAGKYTITVPGVSGTETEHTNIHLVVTGTSATTFSISGNISGAGGPGATVTLSGSASATTTADGSGNYLFSGLSNGSYVITPSMAGFTYVPTNQSETISGSNVSGVNFSSAANAFGFELEDGSGVILLEDGSILLLENQA